MNLSSTTLINDDSLKFIKTLPDNCIDLIATDPPYFRVKDCSWDNQWNDVTAYLAWLDELLAEFWRVPNEGDYQKLQVLFDCIAKEKHQRGELNKPYSNLVESHQILSRQYDELRQEYGLMRRSFTVTADVPYTDVWQFAPVQYYPGKHPCEKPADLMTHIIQSSSREGDLVADFFMGSGATLKAALKLNRRVLGVELEEERFKQTEQEINEISSVSSKL
ncbi:DNA-methyltransferase [Xenorhabdus stockiae]|uniref:DNA-methyltransferase n=1 Tax=Xenorhabdus stockiae TaxID=351614 RepID=UPI003CE7C80A